MIKFLTSPSVPVVLPAKPRKEPRGVQFVRAMEDSQRRAELPRRILKAAALGGAAALGAKYAAPLLFPAAASMARNAKFVANRHVVALGKIELGRWAKMKKRFVGHLFKRLLPKSIRPAEKPVFLGAPEKLRSARVMAEKRAGHYQDLVHGAIQYQLARGAMRGMLVGRRHWRGIGAGVTGGTFAYGQYRALRRRHQALERAWDESLRGKQRKHA